MGAPDLLLTDEGFADPAAIALSMLTHFADPPRQTVSQWADANRRLPTKGAAEPGQWRTDRTPFLREIMDSLSADHPAQRIIFQKPVQIGGTEVGNNWVGHFIDTKRAPMMVVQPTLELAERWSKQRLASMIDDCQSLRKKIRPARERDSGNTTTLKEFPGGVLVITGANSAAGLRSMPVQYLMLDEVDAYPYELEQEGDPISLAEGRTTTFGRRAKVLLISTPTIESLSRIAKEYKASDMRRYHVPCPHCGALQVLIFENLHWPKDHPEQAVYHCDSCGVGIEEHHKPAMLAEEGHGGSAKWIAERPEVSASRHIYGYHINALYTPLGLGKTWADLARMMDDCERDPAKTKSFTNLRKGEVMPDPDEKLDADELKERAGTWLIRTIPNGCLLLTAGVDVQKDRFVVVILGWGRESRIWVIDYVELQADPTSEADWVRLEAYLDQSILNSHGIPMRLSMRAVDSGYLQEHVLHFTRHRQHRGWMAVRGASTGMRPIVTKPSRVDFNWRGSVIKAGAEQWQVGGDKAKELLFARIGADRKRPLNDRLIHFPADLDTAFYQQLTAEVFDPRRRRWVKIRPRNDALDACVYAMAAAFRPSIRVQSYRESDWGRLAAQFEPSCRDMFADLRDEAVTAETTRSVSALASATVSPTAPTVGKSEWLGRL